MTSMVTVPLDWPQAAVVEVETRVIWAGWPMVTVTLAVQPLASMIFTTLTPAFWPLIVNGVAGAVCEAPPFTV